MSALAKRVVGKPFERGNAGRTKGSLAKRTIAQIEVAQACAGEAFDVVKALLKSPSERMRHEAAKTVLSYAWGLPRQIIDVLDLRVSRETQRLATQYGVSEDEIREELAAMGRELAQAEAARVVDGTVIDSEIVDGDNGAKEKA